MSWTTNHVPLSKSFVQKSPNICNTTIAKENSGPETRCPRLSTGAIFSQSRAWEWVSKVSTKWGTHHNTELNGFFKARRWDARSASHRFHPIFPNEFGFPPSAGRIVFSPRSRCEPKISLAQTFLAKRPESEAILSND